MVKNRNNSEGIPRIIMSKNGGKMDILKILQNDYEIIYKSVLKENFEFSHHESSFFKELLFNNKVVGFVVYDVFFSIFTITDFYILPKFRNKNILLKEIYEIYESGNKINFFRPDRDLVELLIDYGFARDIVDGIVVSAINFEFEDYNILSNTVIYRDDDEIPSTNLFDLNICSAIYAKDFSNPDTYTLFYYEQSQKDFEKYGPSKVVDNDYLQETSKLMYKNGIKLKDAVFELKKNLPKSNFDFNNLIGEDEGLTDYFKDCINEGLINENQAYEIKKQLTEEYHEGLVNNDGLSTRFNFLLNYDSFKDFMMPVNHLSLEESICPFCGNTFMLSDSFCSICGFNLNAISEDTFDNKHQELINLFKEDREVYDKLHDPYFNISKDFSTELFMKLISNNDMLDGYLDLVDEDYSPNEKKILSLIFKVFQNDEDTVQRVFNNSISDEDFERIFLDKILQNPEYFFEFMDLIDGDDDYDFEDVSKYKLDDTKYGADYPLNYDQDIFRFLKLINKGLSFNSAFSRIDADSRWSIELFKETLLNQNFIYTDWKKVGQYYKVNELKGFLRNNNLKVSGIKQVLINRLDENKIAVDSDLYCLTDGAIQFLNENYWIGFFDEFLGKFNFNDFSKLKDENPDMDLITLSTAFLDKHISSAKKSDDDLYLKACNDAKRDILNDGEEYIKYSMI